MTATDELRRLLDGRGVEWRAPNFSPEHVTEFEVGGIQFRYLEGDDFGDGEPPFCWIDTNTSLTPAQAVEATLGRGECRDLAETPEYRDKTEFKCSECGYEYSAVGWFGCDCGDEPDFRYCPNCGRKVVDA